MMNELINIFIPPEDATRGELDTAKKNMEKYADYRTYLSFDMQQIIHGEKDMKIGLSKMIKKKFRRRGTESAVYRSAGKFCTGLQDQSVTEDPQTVYNPSCSAG